jgi:ribosomal protein S18 acetylase RimI-like enzyme
MNELKKESMKQIEISEARPEDAEGIAYVQRDAWLVTYPNEKLGITREDIEDRYANMPERISKWESRIEEPMEGRYMLIAKEGEKVVGFCIAKKAEEENNLSAIYINPEYQGRGIGGKLARAALGWLGEAKDISVFVADYNEQAIGFYERLGFKDTGERIEEESLRLKSGNIIPEMKMILETEKIL